jgi:hypothetical protein
MMPFMAGKVSENRRKVKRRLPREWRLIFATGRNQSVEQTFFLVCFEWRVKDIPVLREPFELLGGTTVIYAERGRDSLKCAHLLQGSSGRWGARSRLSDKQVYSALCTVQRIPPAPTHYGPSPWIVVHHSAGATSVRARRRQRLAGACAYKAYKLRRLLRD